MTNEKLGVMQQRIPAHMISDDATGMLTVKSPLYDEKSDPRLRERERVLCVVAHPDDETLGMGATIHKHTQAGDALSIVAFADGLASRGGVTTANIKLRHGMFRRACAILGTEDVWQHQYADNQMDTLAMLQVVKHVEVHIERFKPTMIYTHWIGDLNVDHVTMHDAVNIACRPQPGCTVKRVLYFEVPCSTIWGATFQPDYFVPCEDAIDAKLAACQEYNTELREYPHPRSLVAIRNLALMRGASVGVPYAEAFKIGRIIA